MGITLKQAHEQGSLRIAFLCVRPDARASSGLCMKTGKVEIGDAIKRWGAECKLDAIPARCSRCGSKDFVRASGEPPGRTGKRGNR
jgi:hypothetical protein